MTSISLALLATCLVLIVHESLLVDSVPLKVRSTDALKRSLQTLYRRNSEEETQQEEAAEPVPDGEVPPPPEQPVLPTCGVPAISPNVNLRVVGGVEATPNSWPWMASLQGDGRHFCGGSLINDQWVMSAAHCAVGFRYSSSHEVVLGLHSQSNPDSHSLRVKITGVFPNQKYGRNPGKMGNDVMLLKLEHPVNFTDAISPICLPSAFKKIPGGRRCYATGWGTLSSGGNMPDKLMQVMLPVIDNEVCNQQGWYDGQIDDTMVCAGFEEGGFDTCQGDSGGPFVCYDEDRWILYGVVSWGYGCAGSQHPGLYGRTSPYLKWMNNKMAENP